MRSSAEGGCCTTGKGSEGLDDEECGLSSCTNGRRAGERIVLDVSIAGVRGDTDVDEGGVDAAVEGCIRGEDLAAGRVRALPLPLPP